MIRILELIRTTVSNGLKTVLADWRGRGVEGDDTRTERGTGDEVWHHVGFVSRPKPSAGRIESLGQDFEGGVVILATRQRRTQIEIAEGEVALYNHRTGTIVRLTEAGTLRLGSTSGQPIEIEAGARVVINAASGSDIVLNGGTLKVARVTDPVVPGGSGTPHTHTITGTAGPYPIVATAAPTALEVDPAAGATHVLG